MLRSCTGLLYSLNNRRGPDLGVMTALTTEELKALMAAWNLFQERRPSRLEDAVQQIHDIKCGIFAGSSVSFGTVGRFWSSPCYFVETERFKAALPLDRARDIQTPREPARTRSVMLWESLRWFHPPYLTNADLANLHGDLRNQVHPERALASFLIRSYDQPAVLAATVEQKYARIPVMQDHADSIWSAIKMFYGGYQSEAISVLLPIVESCFRTFGGLRLETDAVAALHANLTQAMDSYSRRIVFLNMWVPCEYRERSFLEHVDEVAHCVATFERYITGSLWVHTDRFTESNRLNRHGILHGLFSPQEYGRPENFFKLISVLDLLAFMHTLGTPNVKCSLHRAVPSSGGRYDSASLTLVRPR